jgi:hypothetical protein
MAEQFQQGWHRFIVADNQDDIIAIVGSNALKKPGIVSVGIMTGFICREVARGSAVLIVR